MNYKYPRNKSISIRCNDTLLTKVKEHFESEHSWNFNVADFLETALKDYIDKNINKSKK